MAPSVAGADFIVYWTEVPVGALFNRIKLTMPRTGRAACRTRSTPTSWPTCSTGTPIRRERTSCPRDKAELDRIMIVAAE